MEIAAGIGHKYQLAAAIGSIGLHPDEATLLKGRNRVGHGALGDLKRLRQGQRCAAVAQPGRLKTGLLGMSFLEKLDETSFRKDRLLLRN